MTLTNRSMVTIDDLSNREIEEVFSLTDEMSEKIGQQSDIGQGKILASLFFEPSTRTRLSFETAMLRLGGKVITAADVGSTSLSKGESIADMARIIGSYADIIVIRHPWEGAARIVAEYSGLPVINAGDGGHEHPTQTLCDLYTIQKERQNIKGLKIALWGDLKYGRTIHSLTYALARFGATILFRPGPGLEMPEHILRKLTAECEGEVKKYGDLGRVTEDERFPLNAIYMTPSGPHQLAMIPDVSLQIELETGVDALYVTRLQAERLSPGSENDKLKKDYPVVNKKFLKGKKFQKTLVMHPLPRVDELAYEMDADPRSMYFKQAERGVPVRMALISLLLGKRDFPTPNAEDISFFQKRKYPIYKRSFGVNCSNSRCVTTQDTEAKYIKPEFRIINKHPVILRCVYCEHEVQPAFVASTNWHEGKLENKKYHRADSHWADKIDPQNLILFKTVADAEENGFKPSSFAKERVSKSAGERNQA